MMETIADNITKVRARIQYAARESSRDASSIRLLAVSKTRSSGDIRAAFTAGVHDFGENYLQEALPKVGELKDLPIIWHFIGPLQSNKAAAVATTFDWVHSLDRIGIAERLGRHRSPGRPLNVCIQVNIDHEASKSGIAPDDLPGFARQVASLPGLALRGLMAIPHPEQNAKQSRDQLKCAFMKMQKLFLALQESYPTLTIDTLSMGMSADLELAIASGSTLVRIGTGIFGPRSTG